MSARESAEVRAALADIEAGMSRREAAALHGVDESSIYRARARRGLPRLPRAAAAARRAARQVGPTMP